MYIQGELGYSLEIKPSVWFMLQLKNVGLSGWRTFTFFPTLQVFELLTFMSTYDLAYLFQTPCWHSTTQNKHNQTQQNKTKHKNNTQQQQQQRNRTKQRSNNKTQRISTQSIQHTKIKHNSTKQNKAQHNNKKRHHNTTKQHSNNKTQHVSTQHNNTHQNQTQPKKTEQSTTQQ